MYKNSHFCQSIFSITEVFRGNIQVYLESVFNNEVVAWYISYLNQGPGIWENYQLPTLLVPMALLEISIVLFLNTLEDTLCHFLEVIL